MEANEIAKMAQIASALEVSGYPKPGNVHRTRDYSDMVFEDFIISGIVIGDTIREACTDVDVENPKLGKYILQAVAETDKWIRNNTNLGIVMMITPIAVAAAITAAASFLIFIVFTCYFIIISRIFLLNFIIS